MLKLNSTGKKLIEYSKKHGGYTHDMPEDHELFDAKEQVLTSSDDFLYCLQNGYVGYESFLDEKSIEIVEAALDTISQLEDIVRQIGNEY